MKRIIALACLMVLLLCVAAAQAAEWREGLGPGQPYTNVPAVDLNEQLGYIMFYPTQDMPVATVCPKLYIYLPREDVMIGEGALRLNTAEDGAVLTVAMDDADLVRQRAMTEDELDAWMWGGGSCFEIRLPRTLAFGKTYFVTMAQGCIVTADGIASPAIDDRDAWRITLAGDYGIGALETLRPAADGAPEATVLTAQPGDEIRFHLQLGGDAKSAVLYSRDLSVDFPAAYFEESAEVVGYVTADTPAWGVMFFDAAGERLDQLEF